MACAAQRPQRAQQGRVGELGLALLHPFAPEHERVLIREPLLELPHQPRLADAGLSAEQHQRGSAGGGSPDVRLPCGDDGMIECRLHSGLLSNEFM